MAVHAPEVPSRRHALSDLTLAFSLANLMFLEGWSRLTTDAAIFETRLPTRHDYLGTMAAVLVTTLLFFGLASTARRLGPRWLTGIRALVPLALVPPLVAFLFDTDGYVDSSKGMVAVLAGVAVLGVGVLLVRGLAWRLFRTLLRIAAPIAILLFGLGTVGLVKTPWQPVEPAGPTPLQSVTSQERVLWIILDEFDLRVLLEADRLGVRTPEIARLRGESLWAEQAFPPGQDTGYSLPRFLTGEGDVEFGIDGFQLMRRGSDGNLVHVPWTEVSLIFEEVRKAGFPVRLVGTGVPYCRMFTTHLDACAWEPSYLATWTRQRPPTIGKAFRAVFEALVPGNARQVHLETFLSLVEETRRMAADDTPGLLFVHYLMPHLPAVFDGKSEVATRSNLKRSGYLGNMVLADKGLGEIRRAMEQSGTWDDTTVIVSSDHSWRDQAAVLGGRRDNRIPFLFKPAGDSAPLSFDTPFNTLVTRDLVLAVLRGEVLTSEDAAMWITNNPREFTHLGDGGRQDDPMGF